ncbi:hypothetical protein C8F01DRAFT_324407 [Mycena amicta]|nr:hypothetical protein C8F01DRAFT_324407 [Mycena amicta]
MPLSALLCLGGPRRTRAPGSVLCRRYMIIMDCRKHVTCVIWMSLATFVSVSRPWRCVAHLARQSRAYSLKGTPPKLPSTTAKVLSSCEQDTIIKGVNYLKGQTPVVALPDEEYPEWLWTVLDPRVWPGRWAWREGRAGRASCLRIKRKSRTTTSCPRSRRL